MGAIHQYQITLKHDEGKTKLQVAASSMSNAIRQVVNAESCPLSAIYKAKRL